MQAGELIDFAKPFEGKPIELSLEETRAAYVRFDKLRKMLAMRVEPANALIRNYPTNSEIGEITVGEAGFLVDGFDDGSYLWVLVYRYFDEMQDPIDVEPLVLVEEHRADHLLLTRNIYHAEGEKVLRWTSEFGEEENVYQDYSAVDMQKGIAFVSSHANTPGHELQESSDKAMDHFVGEALAEQLESSLGSNNQPVTVEELYDLQNILRMAVSAPSRSMWA